MTTTIVVLALLAVLLGGLGVVWWVGRRSGQKDERVKTQDTTIDVLQKQSKISANAPQDPIDLAAKIRREHGGKT